MKKTIITAVIIIESILLVGFLLYALDQKVEATHNAEEAKKIMLMAKANAEKAKEISEKGLECHETLEKLTFERDSLESIAIHLMTTLDKNVLK